SGTRSSYPPISDRISRPRASLSRLRIDSRRWRIPSPDAPEGRSFVAGRGRGRGRPRARLRRLADDDRERRPCRRHRRRRVEHIAGPRAPRGQGGRVFVAGDKRFRIRPAELGVQSDWRAAVDDAQRQGSGFGPLRGIKRLGVDVFGADVTPSTTVLTGALHYELDRMANAVDQPPRNASLTLRGSRVAIVPARPGRTLDKTAAEATL